MAALCIVGILAASCKEPPQDIPESQIQIEELELEVIPPPSAYTYPFDQALHSNPLVIQFNILAKDEDGNLIDQFEAIKNPLGLYRIDYVIIPNPPLLWPPEAVEEETEEATISPPSDDTGALVVATMPPILIQPFDLTPPPLSAGILHR